MDKRVASLHLHTLASVDMSIVITLYKGGETLDDMLQRPLHSGKCSAWVDISKRGIIGLFWFENADEEAVTVIKERFIDVLNKFWRALGIGCGVNRDVQWFQ